jgi:ApaG protein
MNTPKPYDIDVSVKPEYLADQSNEDLARYAFAYTITITNRGAQTAQLINRHWLISHSDQKQEEIRGEGVVGEQPVLRPGQSFTYTSGAVLCTPIGSMQGSYQMISEDGHQFDALIPVFTLAKPHFLN